MPHIFISYAKKDTRLLAERLYHLISDLEDFSAWMDKSLEAAESWAWQIQEELEKSDLVIVLLSPDVNRRPSSNQRRSFVLNEIDFAQQLNKPILPIMAEQTISPVQLAGLEYIDLTQGEEQGIERLLRRLSKLKVNHPPVHEKPKAEVALSEATEFEPTSKTIEANTHAPLSSEIPESRASIHQSQSQKANRRFTSIQLLIGIGLIASMLTAVYLLSTRLTSTAIVSLSEGDLDSAIESAYNFAAINNADWQPSSYAFSDGVDMLLVPIGCFIGGENFRQICIEEPFWIDQTEVTQADFQRLNGRKERSNRVVGDTLPVDLITQQEAASYCGQLGKTLPTLHQWQYAASGVDNLSYPWGNNWDANKLSQGRLLGEGTLAVGSFPDGASWVGAYDMAGNVWEWTSERIFQNFVIIGGSYSDSDEYLFRTPTFTTISGDTAQINIGFRCVRSID